MDGENHGKPYDQWMIWGNPPFKETPIYTFGVQLKILPKNMSSSGN